MNQLKTLFLIIGLMLLTAFSMKAQEAPRFKGGIVYFELGGNSGPTIALNAEYLFFSAAKVYVNGHAGYGIGRVDGNSAHAIPIGINAFHGIKNSHMEVGLGLTYIKGYRAYYLGNDAVLSKALYFAPNIAYRFQKTTGGFFFKVTYTPLFRLQEYAEPEDWFPDSNKTYLNFGVGLGYYFARSKKVD